MSNYDGPSYPGRHSFRCPDDELPEATTIQEHFEQFHERHPEVYVELLRLAQTGVRAGRTKLGIWQLVAVLRWNRSIEGLPDEREDYKINNNYASRYARLLMEQNPELEGIFELRRLLAR